MGNFKQLKSFRFWVMVGLLVIAVGLEHYFCVVLETHAVYTHLFYIPIVLAAIWWGLKGGFFVSLILAFLHMRLHLSHIELSILSRSFALIFVGSVVGIITNGGEKAEWALRESGEKFKNLLETAVDPILILDKKGRFVLINHKVTKLTGFTEKDLIGKHFAKIKILTPKSKLICLKNFAKRMLGKDMPPYEVEALTKNGNIISAEINANPIKEKGEIVGDLVILRNITERKKMEKALKESEERFRALTESTSDWIWEVDENAVYTYASPKVKEFLGYEPEEIVGKTPFDLMSPEEAKRVAAEFGAIAETRKPFDRLENANLHKDGRIVMLETNGVPIFDTNGNFRGYRGIDRDITKRKELEKQRLESNRRLQEVAQKLIVARDELKVAIETRGEFMNIAAHELKTPLQPIIGFTDRLLHTGKPSRWQKKRLTIILDNAKHLQKLVQDVLDINKMETGIMKFSMEKCDLLEIIKKVYESSKPSVETKKLKFILDISEARGPIKIKGDPNRLHQVFSNLLDNAVKFTDKGSIKVQVKEGKNTVTVGVKDTGIGIAKRDMTKLFIKFSQVDGTDKRKQSGTGLGLAICKEIIRAHKGKISVQSILSKGSTFQVVLPKLIKPAKRREV